MVHINVIQLNVIQLFSYLIYIVVTFIYCRRPSYEESTHKDINARVQRNFAASVRLG